MLLSRMVNLLLPYDVNSSTRIPKVNSHIDDDDSISNSVIESRSQSAHSDDAFEETDPSETGNQVIKNVCKSLILFVLKEMLQLIILKIYIVLCRILFICKLKH